MTGADAWGVQQDWTDAGQRPQRASDETVARIREAVGRPSAKLADRAPIVTRPGRRIGVAGTVLCEDGSRRELDDVVPEDFPLGYHTLLPRDVGDLGDRRDRGERRLIVSPGRCWQPERQRWGWTVQLYAARSRTSWGVGDLGDLRALREWTEHLGGGFLLVNPLHAVAPTLPQEPSPYLPATRRFRNPIYLRVDDLADDEERAAGRELAGTPLVDRDASWTLKRQVLRRVFDAGPPDDGFARWRRGQGRPLEEFAQWCALADEHGPDWREWPEQLRDPRGAAVAAYALDHAGDVSFHAWLQWLLDRQLREATGSLPVVQDLPIGVAGGGVDAWAWQDLLAQGVSVGAPPDALNTVGQDWGSPPLIPWRLRAAGYEPFVAAVRATIAGAGGLRIDHVMGLFRLWWVPEGAPPADGAYVRYPADDLLDIVALESHRASAVVVGEDLGTVEPGVREALTERGILSYRVLWFQAEPPAQWPPEALATVTTHDLPTVAGLWTGSDADDQLASTEMSADDVRSGRDILLGRVTRTGVPLEAPVTEAVRAAYAQLAEAPCLLVSLALEDAVAEERRPNVPGSTVRDNWRIPLRVPVEDLPGSVEAAELVRLVAQRLDQPGTASPTIR